MNFEAEKFTKEITVRNGFAGAAHLGDENDRKYRKKKNWNFVGFSIDRNSTVFYFSFLSFSFSEF